MAKRRLMGYKHQTHINKQIERTSEGPAIQSVIWKRPIFHRISPIEVVNTPHGEMLLCHLKHQADIINPNTDVAMLVGHVSVFSRSGKQLRFTPELWFYDDKFWLKAKNSDGSEYYNKHHQYLLYRVQVDSCFNADG